MESSLQHVALVDLEETIGTPPSTKLCASVERMGVVQPVLLCRRADEFGELRLVIIDGNRRVAAARSAQLSQIPAIVFEDLTPQAIAEATLVTNGFRSANALAEFWALKHLARNHYSSKDIAAISGMASSTINHRNSLSNLDRSLFVALRHGKIGQTEAIAVAKLPKDQQSTLAETFRRTGNLTRSDIKSISADLQPVSTPTDTLMDELKAVASAAAGLGYNRGEFLELAARKWDEVNG